HCKRHHNESMIQHLVPDPAASTAQRVTGRAYVYCLCRTTYYITFVHEVDTATSVGEASIRSAAESSRPVTPSPSPSLPASHSGLYSAALDMPMGHRITPAQGLFYFDSSSSAAVIWAAVEAAKKSTAAIEAAAEEQRRAAGLPPSQSPPPPPPTS